MRCSRRFEHAPSSVPAARRFATEALRGAPRETVESVALMVSELASNCIRHTDSGFEMTITRTAGEIRVEARDGGDGQPQLRSPNPSDASGRGLRIVEMLSGAWGVKRPRGPGKVVWFSIAPTPAGATPRR